jgi:integrase
MTPKNMALIRQISNDEVWRRVVNLPTDLMKRARGLKDRAPMKAAVTAEVAIAIAILSVAPVRAANLTAIRLGQNLIRPGGLKAPYLLVFPNFDVKNRVDLTFELDDYLTDLIDEYVQEYRPTLLRGHNGDWLFPGTNGGSKDSHLFGIQITERIVKATGLRITMHQFRHAAAAIYLKYHPGDYETVRRLLGHRSLRTTVNFYCGLETIQASREFNKIVRKHLRFDPDGYPDGAGQ